jgi:hypothetical protein
MAKFFYAEAGHRSMIRLLAVVATLAAGTSLADPPHFSAGGFNLGIQYGPGFWTVDKAKLGADPGGKDGLMVGPTYAGLFVDSLQNTHTVSLSLAYNILGHASIGADLTATGWRLFDATRGGGGMAIGKVAWHPLELFFMKKDKRPIPIDFSTFFGVGYGIVGGATAVAGAPTGMDGLLFEWGANIDYYFARSFGLGFFVRGVFLNWDKFYLDFNNRDVMGNTITLSKPLGGSFWTIGITVNFRGGE